MNRALVLTFAAIASLVTPGFAGDRYVSAPWSGLRFEGEAPKLRARAPSWAWAAGIHPEPYAVLDGGGEVYLHFGDVGTALDESTAPLFSISIRADEALPLKGRFFLPSDDGRTIAVHRFEVASPATGAPAERQFHEDMEAYYSRLLRGNLPGAAWFRHREGVARAAQQKLGPLSTPAPTRRDPADLLDLFSGARAVAENLDLDRELRVASEGEKTIDVSTISGVKTRALDWKTLLAGKEPELDPLAKLVPADQHAIFFPTFEAMTRVFDEADARGTPLLEFFEARVEDLKTKERYQEQMLLPLSTLGRLLGPAVVASVALTGSDPFLPSGTDLVLLFDCKQPALLEGMLAARRAEAEKNGADHVDGSIGAVAYVGCARADRTISSYVARLGTTVVVTNSLPALVRVAQTATDPTRALAAADEYVWFRDRYKHGDAAESALIVLTDATIRRWAGPRARIGDARRLRAAAAMAEIQARSLDAPAASRFEVGASAAAAEFPVSQDFVWTKHGVHSPKWGSLAFLTPVSELDVNRVSAPEKQAYEAFRSTFQTRWRNYFDPIAVRVSLEGGRMRVDATIRPLTIDSEYKELDEITRGAELAPSAGDPHEGALFHLAFAFNRTSTLGRMFDDTTSEFAKQFGADPLGWLGGSVALYGERDPWWEETRAAGGVFDGDDVNYYAIPIALQVAVKDPLKLAVFLTALRAIADQSAPNLTTWENRTWQETTYVRVAASESLMPSEPGREPAIYYVPLPDALVISQREDLVKNAIERRKSRKSGTSVAGGDRAWLGTSAGLRLDGAAIDFLASLTSSREPERAAQAAWSAIPILNEWKRLFPGEDPVAVHERLWGVRLVAPSGGTFLWNDTLQSMESSVHGRPGAMKDDSKTKGPVAGLRSAELGLTFEADGLRAVVELVQDR